METKKVTLFRPELIAVILMALVSGGVLLIYILLGQYANPSADDFCMAAGVNQDGLLAHLWRHYHEWSGRYSGNALYGLYPLLFGMFDGYRFMPVLLILLLISGFAFFLSSLLKIRLNDPLLVLVSLAFTCIYLLGLVSPASSLYWMAGALTYQSANISLLFLLGLMIKLHDRLEQGGRIVGVLTGLLLLLVFGVGLNEVNMLVLTILSGAALMYHVFIYPSQRRNVLPWLLLFAAALLCVALVYFAPGTAMRESTFPLRHQWGRSLSGSLNMGLWTLGLWLRNPVVIAGVLLTPFADCALRMRSQRKINISKRLLFILSLVTLAIPLVLQFPAWWGMGGWPPPRTVDAIFFVFLLSLFLTLSAFSLYWLQRENTASSSLTQGARPAWALIAFTLLFVLAVLVNGKFQRALGDLMVRAKPYHAYLEYRYETIQEALSRGQFSLQTPSYQGAYPRTIYFNDILPNSRDWRNVCYANYFGLQRIRRMKRNHPDVNIRKRNKGVR